MRITHLLGVGFVCALGPLVACGQATFLVSNYNSLEGVDAPVYDWDGNLLAGPEWRAEVYGGATQDSLTPTVGYDYGLRVPASFHRPGYFRGADYVAVSAVPDRGLAWLQVKVWNVQLGATYEEAVVRGLGGYGQSDLFSQKGGAPNASPPVPPSPLLGLRSFSVLEPIPEPSTWALAALGGAALWAGRRKAKG